jgi:group I intron endonuclease
VAIVYLHKKKNTDSIFYVGIGSLESRAYSKSKRTELWHKYANKYGYDVDITHKNICWEEACSIEKYLISFYGKICDDTGCLVNMTDGGDGTFGRKCNEITKAKISNKAKERLSDKSRHPMFGKKQSLDSIEKNRLSQKGDKSSMFGRRGSLHPKFNISPSESHINILKDRMSGDRNPNYGIRGDKNKISKKVIAFKNGEYFNLPSITEAAIKLNLSSQSISACCRNKIYSTGGFRFKYESDDKFIGEFIREKRKLSQETKDKIAASLLGKKRGKYASTHKSATTSS